MFNAYISGSGSRLALQTFSDSPEVYFGLNDFNDKASLLNALMVPYYDGGTTNIFSALQEVSTVSYINGKYAYSNLIFFLNQLFSYYFIHQ